jgi:hypothetical protein
MVRNMEVRAAYDFLRNFTRKSYGVVCATIFWGCVVIIARVHVISVPLARMEFWHMEAPYANVIRP